MQFWELDTDHDFIISKEDLIRYGNHSLTYRIIDRIFQMVSLILLLESLVLTPILADFKEARGSHMKCTQRSED